MILLDTDICIEILRGNEGVIRRRRKTNEDVAISFVTAAELYFGAYRSRNPKKNRDLVDRFLLTIEIHHSDLEIVERFGEIKARLQRLGKPLADADVLIAATAICHNETLVSGNLRHYERIGGLLLEDWLMGNR
jgi:tRNA(fMet)-specific endonuclease VapC